MAPIFNLRPVMAIFKCSSVAFPSFSVSFSPVIGSEMKLGSPTRACGFHRNPPTKKRRKKNLTRRIGLIPSIDELNPEDSWMDGGGGGDKIEIRNSHSFTQRVRADAADSMEKKHHVKNRSE